MLHIIKELNNRVLSGRTVVVGMGKAAAAMAMAVESHWVGELSGVVVVPEGASRPLQRIRVLESSHPVPDELAVQAYPAKVVKLLISDIPGDEPSLIASGPTLPDASTCAQALAVLQRYAINGLPVVYEALSSGAWESVKPHDPRLASHSHHAIASAWDGMRAAAVQATVEGLTGHILSDAMEGEARELAKAHGWVR